MLERLKILFDRVLSGLPGGTAALNIYRVPKGDGTVIELRPSNRDAASVGVHVDDGFDLVDFSFGSLGTWELPQEGRNHSAGVDELLAEVEQMCRAVIAGNCDESRGLFSLTSKIYVDGYVYKVVDLPMFPVPPFGTRKYAPYVSTRA